MKLPIVVFPFLDFFYVISCGLSRSVQVEVGDRGKVFLLSNRHFFFLGEFICLS
jgi:hypothetical protein